MTIDRETLQQVAQDLCATMLGFEFSLCGDPNDMGLCAMSTLTIRGDDSYRLMVSAPYLTASVIASRIFGMPPRELDEGLILDAVGEVANIIGGNVKGILNGEYSLTLPTSIMAVANSERAPAGEAIEIAVSCDGLPLRICLQEESAVAA